jgi:ferredoxin-NADP reductase
MSREKFSIKLQEKREIASMVYHFTFVREDGQPFDFIAGQFVNLFFPVGDDLIQRSYSLANSPQKSPIIELAVSYVSQGKASDYLFNMPIGESVLCSGPFGRLTLREEQPKRYVLIGTGTGVTPYRSMLPELANRIKAHGMDVVLMLGARTPNDLLYRDEFLKYHHEHSSFTFIGCCSRSVTDTQQEYERKGYIQEHLDDLQLNPSTDIIFLCGNPNMIDAVYEKLVAMGFDAKTVRREKYVFSH